MQLSRKNQTDLSSQTESLNLGGIIVFFYHDDHPPPHFHALYEGLDAQFDMKGNVIQGYLPAKAVKLIQEWAALHETERLENWERARNNLPLNWIAPLR